MNRFKYAAMCAIAMMGLVAGAMTLAEASKSIGDAVADPAKMTAIVKALKPADQVAFVKAVNAAIAKLPGSDEDRAEKYRAANVAALCATTAGNFKSVLAEVFASVPVDCLEGIANDLAATVVNRKENPSVTDAQYTAVAEACIDAIVSRTSMLENTEVRSAIAVAMFLKGADGTLPELEKTLYARAHVSDEVAVSVTLPTSITAAEVVSGGIGANNLAALVEAITSGGDMSKNAGEDIDITRVPRTNELNPWNPELERGSSEAEAVRKAWVEKKLNPTPEPEPEPEPEPKPYPGQVL